MPGSSPTMVGPPRALQRLTQRTAALMSTAHCPLRSTWWIADWGTRLASDADSHPSR